MPGGADAGTVEPQLVVVDASVVVGLVASPGAAADALAERLGRRGRFGTLHAPDVLAAEVDSALRGLVLGRRLTAAQGATAREAARVLPIELWPWAVLSDRAWELRDNLSSYDAGYVALAEHLGAVLVTADARIARAGHVRCEVDVFS